MMLHFVIDILALILAGLCNYIFRKYFHLNKPAFLPEAHHHSYLLLLIIGLVIGSVLFGTLNLYLSGVAGFSKSLIGGIAGAILFAEVFKKAVGIKGSTGFYFIPGLCVLIIIGRIGCYVAGLPDYTYGIPTTTLFGVDFGDGILRHPVQLYESFSVLIFFIILLFSYQKNQRFWIEQGFYLFILFYAGQRFIWEFLKPYATLIAEFNLFHLLALLLIGYALFMLLSKKNSRENF